MMQRFSTAALAVAGGVGVCCTPSWYSWVIAGLILLTSVLCLGPFLLGVWHQYQIWRRLCHVPGAEARPILNLVKIIGIVSFFAKKSRTLRSSFQKQIGLAYIHRREKMFKLYSGFQPYVFFYSPETIQAFLSNQALIDKPAENDTFKCIIGEGLILSSGEKWRNHRKCLKSAFNYSLLVKYVSVMNKNSKTLVRSMEKTVGTVDPKLANKLYYCAAEITAETILGVESETQGTISPVTLNFLQSTIICVLRTRVYWFLNDFFFKFTALGKTLQERINNLDSYTHKIIHARREKLKNKGPTNDVNWTPVLDTMLDAGFTNQEIRDHVNTFLGAGTDTTATMVYWALYLLGLHPEIQERLQKEIDGVVESEIENGPDAEDMRKMDYLECVCKESQRLFTVVPKVGRVLNEDTNIGGFLIPKGTNVVAFLYALHRDPDYFSEPEKFYPDRFLPQNSVGRDPYSYLPFGGGPRTCIGQRFALLESKVILYHILRRYQVRSLEQRDKVLFYSALVLKPTSPLPVVLTHRD